MQGQEDNQARIALAEGGAFPILFIGVSQMSGQLTVDLIRERESSAEMYEDAFCDATQTREITYIDLRGEKTVYTGYTVLTYMAVSYYHDFYPDGTVRIMLRKD